MQLRLQAAMTTRSRTSDMYHMAATTDTMHRAMKTVLVITLLTTSACSAVETNIDWLSNSQKIDQERNPPPPSKPSPP